jgi:ribokinase
VSVLVFGSAIADLVFRVPELPSPGHTVLGECGPAIQGGKGANQAIAAARDGAAVAFAGCVGRDGFGDMLRQALEADGVDVSRLATADAPSGLACVCVDAQGHNQIAVSPDANLHARADHVEDELLGPGTTLLLQMEVPPEQNAALIHHARSRGARVILNLAPAATLPEDALRAVSLLVANEHEAAWLARQLGCSVEAGALRRALGTDIAVTHGEAGAEAATAEGSFRVPPFPVRALDTTGAGDAWCGVLAASLDSGLALAAAMRRANAAAALACTRPGTGPAMPLRAETDVLLG